MGCLRQLRALKQIVGRLLGLQPAGQLPGGQQPWLQAAHPPDQAASGWQPVDRRAAATLTAPRPLQSTVWWHAPFLSGGGYSSEALAFALALAAQPRRLPAGRLWLTQHGDAFSPAVWQELSSEQRRVVGDLLAAAPDPEAGPSPQPDLLITICHSEPGAWALPHALYQTSRCPPAMGRAARGARGDGAAPRHFAVGRTMFETDRLAPEHVRRCNALDQVWVPTQFQRRVFEQSGVEAARLAVIPEPVDTDFFDPARASPLPRPLGEAVFGPLDAPASRAGAGAGAGVQQQPPLFTFLSIFKWEERKGWDLLLEAYLTEFSAQDPVELVLLTQPYHSRADFGAQMRAWARAHLAAKLPARPGGGALDVAALARVRVMGQRVAQADLPRLYRSAHAFVLPSRGEGWGRPHVEAMSMGLPVIATNWSGPTAYLDEGVGYPLAVEGLVPITQPGAFQGHRWAQPSVAHLAALLRQVVRDPGQARQRGEAARARMVQRYAPPVVAELVLDQLASIQQRMVSERNTRASP